MNTRPIAMIGAAVLVLGLGAVVAERQGALNWGPREAPTEPAPVVAAPNDVPAPPVPHRTAEDDKYDKCVASIDNDPNGAEAAATAWQSAGGGDAAVHCQALAVIASGNPENGASMLETLANGGKASPVTAAVMLGQAADARMMADQAEPALKDTTQALTISPDDPDLLVSRANAYDSLERLNDALADLNRALTANPKRGDALVLRASIWRRMNQPEQAKSDLSQALALDPNDAEALLERGILRESLGDRAGAREDWTHARTADPNSEAAELAEQNLTLLDAGPAEK